MTMQVINDNDVLNIDSTFHNLCMWKKVRNTEMQKIDYVYAPPDLYIDGGVAYGHFMDGLYYSGGKPFIPMRHFKYVIPSNIKSPIIAIDVFKDTPFSGTVSVENGVTYANVYTSFTGTFYMYIFSETKTKSERYGLEIFNENGEVVFDSSNKYMRMLSNIIAGKTCAVVLHGAYVAESIVGYDPGYPDFWKTYMHVFFINANNEILPGRSYISGTYRADVYRPYFVGIGYENTPFVLDVTNY